MLFYVIPICIICGIAAFEVWYLSPAQKAKRLARAKFNADSVHGNAIGLNTSLYWVPLKDGGASGRSVSEGAAALLGDSRTPLSTAYNGAELQPACRFSPDTARQLRRQAAPLPAFKTGGMRVVAYTDADKLPQNTPLMLVCFDDILEVITAQQLVGVTLHTAAGKVNIAEESLRKMQDSFHALRDDERYAAGEV